jgi:hypothetical protein
MWWKVIIEVLIVAAITWVGGIFWGCVKSSKLLTWFLGDVSELKQLIEHLGPTNIAADASTVESSFGSFQKNIEWFEFSRYASVRFTARLTFIVVGVLLIIGAINVARCRS